MIQVSTGYLIKKDKSMHGLLTQTNHEKKTERQVSDRTPKKENLENIFRILVPSPDRFGGFEEVL